MTPNGLKDRVKAATSTAPGARAGRSAAPDEQVPAPIDEAAGRAAADAVMPWLRGYEADFVDALPAHITTGVFFAAAAQAVTPAVARCTRASLLQSLLTCARFGLIPDGQQAVITADGPLAVFIPTYRGYIELMYRSGRVDSVHVGLIHANDEWSFEPSAPAPLDFTFRPRVELPKAERGEIVLAYAFCWLKGGARSQVVVMSREQAEGIRDEYSKAYQRAEDSGRKDSFWHTHFPEMWSKSAIRAMAKVVPMSADLRALTAADDAGDVGTPQVLHAPDKETAGLVADAERAGVDAESSQDRPAVVPLPLKGGGRGRSKPRARNRDRRGRAA